jgi:hypothetical protein
MTSRLTRIGACALAAAWTAAPAAAADVQRHAIVIGANDGGLDLEPLQYAEDDALRFADVLRQLGEFEPTDVHVLLGPDADALRAGIAELTFDPPAEGEDAAERMVLFYYSGHADARGLRLGADVMSWEELKASIRSVDADVRLGVLDACRAGAITRIKGATLAAPLEIEAPLDAEGEAWLAASSDDEDAQESDTLRSSFFTHYLVSGLRGAADTGSDGYVSLQEAYTYARDRTVARTSGTDVGAQHPRYQYTLTGDDDLVLTDVRKATAHLTFPAGEASDVAVLRLPDNTPVADISISGERAMQLAVEPGRYLLRRRVLDGMQEAKVFVDAGAVLAVDRWGDATTEIGTAKGGSTDGRSPLLQVDMEDGLRVKVDLPDEFKVPKIELRDKPGLAMGLSALLPGAGQAYNGRWTQGGLFLGGVALAGSTGWGTAAMRPDFTRTVVSYAGPNPLAFTSNFLYFWSIADAGWAIHKRVGFEKRRGVSLTLESGWTDNLWVPSATGGAVSVDLIPGISLGLDRTGWMPKDAGGEVALGGRAIAMLPSGRLRPGVFIAGGMRVPTPEAQQQGGGQDILTNNPTALEEAAALEPRGVYGVGTNLRFYATPNYFAQYELRVDFDQTVTVVNGLGFGVHIF